MRWLLLLLLALNAFYYVWHQQQVPIMATDAAALPHYQQQQKDIRLLSESPAIADPKTSVAGLADEQSGCIFLGDFQSKDDAEVFRQRLAGLEIHATTTEVTAVSGTDYWVYLPPLASKSASLLQLKELQARQVDSFIIAEGELENGISLGIFPHHDSAASVIARLTEAGYEPALRTISRNHRSFWVRIDPQWVRLFDEALLASLATGFDGLRHVVGSCEAVSVGQGSE